MGRTSFVDKNRENNGNLNKINKNMKRRGAKSRVQQQVVPQAGMALQKLYLTCTEVFKGTVPSSHDVQTLRLILDSMILEDVGLSSHLPFFEPRSVVKGTPRITFSTIYRCKNFSLCMFFLPPKAVIPLHNHPGMTVFSKLIFGSMHIKSYDWVDPDDQSKGSVSNPQSKDSVSNPQLRLAKMKADGVFTAQCTTSVLYPTSGGNIHSFTAITPCAVLDVLGPPYSIQEDRDCTYYRGFPYSDATGRAKEKEVDDDKGTYGWLEEIEMPKDLKLEGIMYLGPKIIDKKS